MRWLYKMFLKYRIIEVINFYCKAWAITKRSLGESMSSSLSVR